MPQSKELQEKPMPKQVSVFLGEGEDRYEIGTADVYPQGDGSLRVDMYIAGYWADGIGLSATRHMTGLIPEGLRKD